MSDYSYVAQVVTPRNVYHITGDVQGLRSPDGIVPHMLLDLERDKGEPACDSVVMSFSYMEL